MSVVDFTNGILAKIEANRVKIESLEERFNRFISNDFKEVKEAINEIKDKMNSPRPTWALLILSNLLTGIVILFLKVISSMPK